MKIKERVEQVKELLRDIRDEVCTDDTGTSDGECDCNEWDKIIDKIDEIIILGD